MDLESIEELLLSPRGKNKDNIMSYGDDISAWFFYCYGAFGSSSSNRGKNRWSCGLSFNVDATDNALIDEDSGGKSSKGLTTSADLHHHPACVREVIFYTSARLGQLAALAATTAAAENKNCTYIFVVGSQQVLILFKILLF